MRYLKAFALAWNMLTIIPIFSIHTFEKGINARSAMFYPLVGAILGSVLYFVSLLLQNTFAHEHLGITLFALSVVLTGALHLDGLSDTIDGFFVKKSKALEVMKESHVGGMGMIFSGVFLLLKASSFAFLPHYSLLILIFALSRFNAVLSIFMSEYISGGVGKLIKEELRWQHLLISFGFTLFLALLFGELFAFVFALLFTLFLNRVFVARYGGLSGDMYGFIIELSELALLNYFIISYA